MVFRIQVKEYICTFMRFRLQGVNVDTIHKVEGLGWRGFRVEG